MKISTITLILLFLITASCSNKFKKITWINNPLFKDKLYFQTSQELNNKIPDTTVLSNYSFLFNFEHSSNDSIYEIEYSPNIFCYLLRNNTLIISQKDTGLANLLIKTQNNIFTKKWYISNNNSENENNNRPVLNYYLGTNLKSYNLINTKHTTINKNYPTVIIFGKKHCGITQVLLSDLHYVHEKFPSTIHYYLALEDSITTTNNKNNYIIYSQATAKRNHQIFDTLLRTEVQYHNLFKTNLFQTQDTVAKSFAYTSPTYIICDKEGTIIYMHTGYNVKENDRAKTILQLQKMITDL